MNKRELFKNVRTLGMYQPFMNLMLLEQFAKEETRAVRVGKKPPFPLGTYLLYATLKPTPEQTLIEWCGEEIAKKIRERTSGREELYGVALLMAELTQVRPMRLEDEELAYVLYKGVWKQQDKHGVWHDYRQWILKFDDRCPVEPFPIKGMQGVKFLKPKEAEKIIFHEQGKLTTL